MRFHAFLTLIGLLLPLPCAFAQQPSASPAPVASAAPDTGKKSEPLVSFDLVRPRLSEIVSLLGQKYHINIVTDAYLVDPAGEGAERIVMKDVPLSTALPKLAQLFHRDMEVIYGVVVWRHPQWYLYLKTDQVSIDEYHVTWRDAGKANTRREQVSIANSKPISLPVKTGVSAKPDELLPARLVTLEVEEASAHDVARSLSQASLWGVSIDSDIENRRVNMQLHSVTPAQAAELLTLALNARQRIVVGQSEAQKKQAVAGIKDFYDFRRPVSKQSDALKAELRKALTKEQQDKLANNEMIDINPKDLTASLQKQVTAYINASIAEMRQIAPGFPDFDASRGYTLTLRPEADLDIGVNAYSADGTGYHFKTRSVDGTLPGR